MSIRPEQESRRKAVGHFGEQVAAQYLDRTLGWNLLYQNWRCREGEIDIVAVDKGLLVAVEVRTRRTLHSGSPVESVDVAKQRQLLRVTRRLLTDPRVLGLQRSHCEIPVRIDVIGLFLSSSTVQQFVHIRNAVEAS
ncbi:YraN family protein [Alicyclobacillus sp. SO9]|uniref:YraN family protein n=1 Tax=Alicyclobacillus sp. SO9 TaxID=2665646 RepID=UPI0018E70FE6|nr:YraN family protein [Alicyclobacillus sp. SO9]QQE80789.1 YraN family protein [Alicyclobacillus sp. SO9]